MATVPSYTRPIGQETADQRLVRMQAEQAQRQVDRQNARAGTAMQGTYIAPQSSTQFVNAVAAGQKPASPGYAVGQINQPLINAISDGGQFATAVRPVDQYFPMGGTSPTYKAPQQSTGFVPIANPAPSAITAGPSAMVEALRQKPNRYAGLGMGLGTNATTPQSQNVELGKTKTPSGLFQSI